MNPNRPTPPTPFKDFMNDYGLAAISIASFLAIMFTAQKYL